MEQTKKESLLERYWRLSDEADELYQRRLKNTEINEEMRELIQRELDALEDVWKKETLLRFCVTN